LESNHISKDNNEENKHRHNEKDLQHSVTEMLEVAKRGSGSLLMNADITHHEVKDFW